MQWINVLLWVCLLAVFVQPQSSDAQNTYQKPPKAILDVLEAPPPPGVSLDPTGKYLLFEDYRRYPSIAEISRPVLRLAGLRIDPGTNGPHLDFHGTSLTLKSIATSHSRSIAVPVNSTLSLPIWSSDGRRFAITRTAATGIELWVGTVEDAALRQIPGIAINGAVPVSVQWMPDNVTLLCPAIPAGRGKAPVGPPVPTGPVIQETSGKAGPVRTYEDMLQNSHDEDTFDYYCKSQLTLVDAQSGKLTPWGGPALYVGADPSPDGKHLLATHLHRPYSYLLPYYAFPQEVEVWDRKGHVELKAASLPLADTVPIDGVPTGPRDFEWKPSEPATLVWVEALDGGDPKREAARRDRLYARKAPFTASSPALQVIDLEQRYNRLMWTAGNEALIRDFDPLKLQTRTYLIDVSKTNPSAMLIWDKSINERYTDPGTPMMRRLTNGKVVMRQSEGSIFLNGAGASAQGDRPFLDKFDLKTGKSERLFQCDANCYEAAVTILDDAGSSILTRYETTSEPPNYYLRTAGSLIRKPITEFKDPSPQLRGISRQLVTYKRKDGVQLSFTLYLPAGYTPGHPLPTVIWAYPREFGDAGTAGQVSGSPNRFTTIGGYSHLFFLTQGYAVLDDATMPVVGDRETQNNTYIEQIVESARAAIAKATEMGVTDPKRVGVGGHSYGAFMTANLLAHSDLFRAGIARSGAYNRTLTPFGFQSERRTIWEAPEMYMKVSPFLFADKIKAPLLMIHGQADDNSGTFPIQSERMYAAIRGKGGHARLVMLPNEAHGYSAYESIAHTLYEMVNWFDLYVKNATDTPTGKE